MPATPLFSLQNVACARGGRILFQKVSFDLRAGEIVHVSGANGTGKTSFLRMIAGALPIEAGKILWNKKIDFSFLPANDQSLKVSETVLQNLLFWSRLWKISDKKIPLSLRAMNAQSLQDRPVRHLSAGQKRRVSLARTFLKPAPLWLLDEPLNGLDAEATALFSSALKEHAAAGGAAVIASQQDVPGARHLKLEDFA